MMEYGVLKEPLSAFDLNKIRDGLSMMFQDKNYVAMLRNKMIWSQCPDQRAERFSISLWALIKQARVYLWDMDVFNAAITGHEIFSDRPWVQKDTTGVGSFHGFNKGTLGWSTILDRFEIPKESSAEANYFMIQPVLKDSSRDFLSTAIIAFFMPKTDKPMSKWTKEDVEFTVPYIRIFHAIQHNWQTFTPYTMASAIQEFLKLELAVEERVHQPRAERRRLQRENLEEPDIRIVRLRKTAHGNSVSSSKDIDWQHKWIVHGHWRNQWYQSQGCHAPKYISDYVKGPDDKPLLPPKRTIYAVSR